MAEIKSLASIRDKYARVTPQRQEDYAAGVLAPRRDWADAASGGNAAWKAGLQSAITRDAFVKGVRKTGTAHWQSKAATLGAERWGPGVLAGVDAYEAGFGPYRETIEATKLPARYPTGDPRNYERVKAIGEALRKKKVG